MLSLLALVLAMLACAKTPEYKLRGWTPTPDDTATVTPSATPTTAPTATPVVIVLLPTAATYRAVVTADMLSVRSGPGTTYPADPSVVLKRGDAILIMACKYDEAGEAWVNFSSPRLGVFAWAAVTAGNSAFIKPMPGSCG